jgi:MFS family permease
VPSTAAGEFRQSWRILLVAFVGAFFSGLPWATFTVFITPLSRTFGWSLAAISGLGTCFQIGSMISNPLVGRLADRVGVRLVALLSIPSLSLALLGMSVIGPHIWMLYLAAFAIGCTSAGDGPSLSWPPASASVTSSGRVWSRRSRMPGAGEMVSVPSRPLD